MSRRPYVAANWKMNKTASEADEFLDAFLPALRAWTDRAGAGRAVLAHG